MIQEDEVIMFTLGLGILFFILVNRFQMKRIPEHKLLLSAYTIVLLAWILTILEGFFLGRLLNFFEHACYAVSGSVMALWCWKVLRSPRKERP